MECLHIVGGNVNGITIIENSINILVNGIKFEMLCNPTIGLWGMYLKEIKCRFKIDNFTLFFIHHITVDNSQDMQTT